jgi:hypothetical protein
MKNLFKKYALMIITAIALASTAFASDSDVMHINVASVGKFTIPYEHIGDFYSNPNETENQFLLRIRPELRNYSDKTGYEACAEIATDGNGRYGIILGSNHSHLSCVNSPEMIPSNMKDTGEGIHSHGKQGIFNMSRTDKLLYSMGQDAGEYAGTSPDSMDQVTVHGQKLSEFSLTDYQHPGYLATPTGVIHQSGAPSTVVSIQ